jgi:hypothetical protein
MECGVSSVDGVNAMWVVGHHREVTTLRERFGLVPTGEHPERRGVLKSDHFLSQN